ncbi:MAG: N-acetyltransferase [Elusimicrobiota bacterium]
MRKANLDDVKKIHELISDFAGKGLMLPRPLNMIYENIRDFWVIEDDGQISGCCALHSMWENMAEIKSLAVRKDCHGKGYGKELVASCHREAEELHIRKLFALTYIPEFFEKFGYVRREKETMPHKIWSECINCPHFPDCDEILVVKEL